MYDVSYNIESSALMANAINANKSLKDLRNKLITGIDLKDGTSVASISKIYNSTLSSLGIYIRSKSLHAMQDSLIDLLKGIQKNKWLQKLSSGLYRNQN
jgi:hypothetical protein